MLGVVACVRGVQGSGFKAEGGSAKKGSLVWFPVGAILNMIIVDSLLGFCKKHVKLYPTRTQLCRTLNNEIRNTRSHRSEDCNASIHSESGY